MDWMNKVGSILQQYTNTNPSQTTSSQAASDVNQHFDSVASSSAECFGPGIVGSL